MTIQEIEAFLAAVKEGSLTGAAQQLFITQPTLSHRIQSLERELGSALILRGKGIRHIKLTSKGREFVPVAEKWKRLWAETVYMASKAPRQSFRVAATPTLGNYVMPEVYARFIKRDLPVFLNIETFHSPQSYEAIENGSVDAAFIANTQFSKRILSIPVFEEKMVFICGADTPYHGKIHPSELPVHKSIRMDWTHEYSLWHEYWFGANSQAVEADNMRLAEGIIAKTDLWSFAPMSAALAVSKDGNIRYLEAAEAPPNRVIYLLLQTQQNEYVNLLTEDLLTVVRQLNII